MTSTGPNPFGFRPSDDPARKPDPTDVFGAMASSAAGLFDAYARMMSQIAGGGAGGQGQPSEAAPALAEAASIASGSALRYSQALAEIFARHQGNFVSAATVRLSSREEPTPEQLRTEAEDLRSFLRDVSQTAMLEARRLEHELGQLGDAVADGAATFASEDTYKRRWTPTP